MNPMTGEQPCVISTQRSRGKGQCLKKIYISGHDLRGLKVVYENFFFFILMIILKGSRVVK